MLFLDNLKHLRLYKKQFIAPIDPKDKKHGSAILLLSPDYDASMQLINNPFMIIRNMSFQSYYIEKDITYTINHESRLLEVEHDDIQSINEQAVFKETTDVSMITENLDSDYINELYCKMGDKITFFNELYDESIYNEASKMNTKYKQMLYYDRIRNNRTVLQLYKQVKQDCPKIKKTFINYERYKKLNLFIDLYYYNKVYLQNNRYNMLKSIDMYFEFIRRFLMDKRIENAGYTKKTIFIPVNWNTPVGVRVFDFKQTLNPISVIYKKIRFAPEDLHIYDGINIIFFGNKGYFKFNTDKIDGTTRTRFLRCIQALQDNEDIDDADEPDNSSEAIASEIIDKLEKNKGIKIHNLTGDVVDDSTEEKLKAELVNKINDAAKNSADEDQALEKLDNEYDVKEIINDLEDTAEDNIKLSAARTNRIIKAQDKFMEKRINNKSVKDMVNESNKPKELPETSIPIKTINDEWHHVKAINFEKEYDLDADIMKILNSFSDLDKHYPISILDVSIEDTSTSEDSIYTYTAKCEDYSGKRFTLKFDIPKLREGRFMRLRGNEKVFSIEMPLIPISKTDEDITQIVSLYKKIFIQRYYTSAGRSNPDSSMLMKALKKYDGKDITVSYGDNSRICSKYELPIDYIDLAGTFSKISYADPKKPINEKVTFYFNQDELRENAKVDDSKGIPIGIDGKGQVIYYTANSSPTVSFYISCNLGQKFMELFNAQSSPKKSTYARASIFATDIPVIVILAHDLGLTKAMDIAGIEYDISEKRTKGNFVDTIKLSDGYINYKETYTSMIMMNGLKDCDMESISIKDLNKKITWVEQLDNFGGRVKSDGLDNFRDLMYDPITKEVSKDYDLPDNYHQALVYATNLLVDNKYISHTDIKSNRYRTSEVIAAQLYLALAAAYESYALQNKHGRNVPMTMKQSAVLDLILAQNTTSDLSVFQPLSEIESKNMISTKGVGGMNQERAYKIDKRGYDDSMINVISHVTGFANTVGVNRQTTIDPNIVGGRGYFKQSGVKDMTVTSSLSMTEAISPFTTTSDDPFRNDMTFTQTAKHSTPIDYGTPLLVTSGGDAAMPYLCSDMFAHKAKYKGKVKEITDEYMIVDYDNGKQDYVRLDEQTKKNSDGGFFITLQLKTDLKPGDTVKPGTIMAYDKKSFSTRAGSGQVAYNVGCLTKVAVMSTEDGFEDSGFCSEWLTEAMSSDIVVMKDVNLPPMTNILFLAKKGQKIIEGEPVMIFQNAYDEEDANLLLKNLNNEDGDVSEIGRNVIRSKVTGIISDIKVYRTCDIDQLSDSLKKIVKTKEAEVNKLKKIASKSETEVILDSTDKLPMVGKLKHVDGVLIEIYMRYHDVMSVGDKTSTNANKNIIMGVYPDSEAPYTDFRPNEAIDHIMSASAMDGRMITSIMKTGMLNKCMIELSRKVCDIMGVKWYDLHEIRERELNK